MSTDDKKFPAVSPDFTVTLDKLGHVASITPVKITDDDLEQSDDMDEDILAHFGVKGMKWGVRRTRAERRAAREAPSDVTVKNKTKRKGSEDITISNKAGKGVGKVKGGKRNIASADANKVAAAKQKAKKSTMDSLSNAELKAAVERMNLEQQYKRLEKNNPTSKRGGEFLKRLMVGIGPEILDAVKKDK